MSPPSLILDLIKIYVPNITLSNLFISHILPGTRGEVSWFGYFFGQSRISGKLPDIRHLKSSGYPVSGKYPVSGRILKLAGYLVQP